MVNFALLIKSCDGLSANYLAPGRVHGSERHVRIDGADYPLHHLAALVDLCDDAIGQAGAVGGTLPSPSRRARIGRSDSNVAMAILADAGDYYSSFV